MRVSPPFFSGSLPPLTEKMNSVGENTIVPSPAPRIIPLINSGTFRVKIDIRAKMRSDALAHRLWLAAHPLCLDIQVGEMRE